MKFRSKSRKNSGVIAGTPAVRKSMIAPLEWRAPSEDLIPVGQDGVS
jgi:hypothetical protein